MAFPVSIFRWGLVVVAISSCGTPPTYTLVNSVPVTVNGGSCQAEFYDVAYDNLFETGSGRRQGGQIRIECGAAKTTCGLDQSLEACVADIERPETSGNGSGYTAPAI